MINVTRAVHAPSPAPRASGNTPARSPRKRRLRLLGASDLRGRLAADASLTFALAGLRNDSVFLALYGIAADELRRCGSRSSFGPRNVLHVAERVAASGGDGTGGAGGLRRRGGRAAARDS